MEKDLPKFIIAIVVSIIILLQQFLTSFIVKIFLAVAAGSIVYFIDAINGYFKNKKTSKKKEELILDVLNEFKTFIIKNVNRDIKTEKITKRINEEDIKVSTENISDIIGIAIKESFSDKNENEQNSIFLIYLFNLIDKEKDDIKRSFLKKRVESILDTYELIESDKNTKVLLDFYNNYQNGIQLYNKTNNLDYKTLLDNITKKYSTAYNFAVRLSLEKKQVEEFRKTLSELILRGKISTKLLSKQLEINIEKNLNKRKNSRAFLLLSNKFYKIPKIDKIFNSFPGIKFGRKWSNKMSENINFLHMRLIYPTDVYSDPKDFLEKEIIPNIPTEERSKGFISIIPLEGTEIFTYPESSKEIKDEKIRAGYSSISSIKTGLPLNLADVVMSNLDTEVNMNEILSIIPFNIFIPNESERRKRFIIDHYEEIKSNFNVKTLSDWSEISPNKLKRYLIKLDETTKKRNRVAKNEAWGAIANKVVTQAKKHSQALFD